MEWPDNKPDTTAALLAWASDELAYRTVTGHLERRGLRILDRGWRCADGQADIIAADRRVLVVCQIISRPIGGRLWLVLACARARRLRLLGVRWQIAHSVLYDEVRVDIVSLARDASGEFIVAHVRGVG
jgi:putative endonuclease